MAREIIIDLSTNCYRFESNEMYIYYIYNNIYILYIPGYILFYISFATTESEAFASDAKHSVPNFAWIPDAFAFQASRLLFRPLSSRVALAGLGLAFPRARISESRATDVVFNSSIALSTGCVGLILIDSTNCYRFESNDYIYDYI